MEDNKTGSTSDRDKKMMGKFESYADKRERVEKEKAEEAEAKRLLSLPGLFERPAAIEEEDKVKDVLAPMIELDEPEGEEATEEVVEAAIEAVLSAAEEEPADGETEDSEEDLEAAAEDLTEDEAKMVIGEYADDHLETEESEEVVALLENMKETGSIEEGFDKTVEEFGLEEEAEADEAEVAAEEPALPEVEAEEDETEDLPTATVSTTPPVPPLPPEIPLGTPDRPEEPPSATPDRVRGRHDKDTDPSRRYQRGADLLVGGIFGYLIGRRKGRIKTEAELLPIQAKLEGEVKGLHEQIDAKEAKIRKMVAQQAEKRNEEPLLQRRMEDEDQQEAMTRRSFESINNADYAKDRSERLGHLLVPPVELEAEAPKTDVDKLNMTELLAMATNIKRDGVSLRQMFENGRLDAEGLRRVVKEYLGGEHFERVLADNIKNLESHERLDRPGASLANGGAYGLDEQATVNPLLGMQSPSNPSASYGSQQYPAELHNYYADQQKRQAATIGIGIGLVIAVVILFLIILFM